MKNTNATYARFGNRDEEDNAAEDRYDSDTAAGYTLVFVYGSLMSGFGNHDIMARNGARLVGDYRFVGGLMIDLGAFPAVITSQEGIIHGELYEVPNASDGLRDLDMLEGFNLERPDDGLYIRRNVEVRPEDSDEIVRAEIYIWNRHDEGLDYDDLVQSGDWRTDHGTTAQEHDCMEYAVPYTSDGALGHGFECGRCGAFLQAG